MKTQKEDREVVGAFYKVLENYRARTGLEPDLKTPIDFVEADSEQVAISRYNGAEAAIEFNGYYLVFVDKVDRNHWINIVGVAENATQERQTTQVHAGRGA